MNQDFLDKIIPAAVEDEKTSGVPAEVTVGQAILESGWGQSQLATMANNLFGIKSSSDWDGETVKMYGKEYIGGKWYTHELIKWRKYDNMLDSVRDHSKFLHKYRYSGAFKVGNSWQAFLLVIKKAGYATDPKYVPSVIRVLQSGTILEQIQHQREILNESSN